MVVNALHAGIPFQKDVKFVPRVKNYPRKNLLSGLRIGRQRKIEPPLSNGNEKSIHAQNIK